MRSTLHCFTLGVLLFALCIAAEAQDPKRVPRIGFVTTRKNFLGTKKEIRKHPPSTGGLSRGLRAWVISKAKTSCLSFAPMREKRNKSQLWSELVKLKVDVLVLGAPPAIRAAKQATKTIPIVFVTTQNPVAAGFVETLARPGGNITGLTRLTRELSGKRLELLKEVLPGTSRVAALVNETQTENDFKPYEAPARALKIRLTVIKVREPTPDFEAALKVASKWRATALVIVSGSLFSRHIKRFAELAISHRLPSMHERIQYVEAGGLMSYSANDPENYRRAATYVDKILKGVKPADLPVEQPTDFEFAINLKTAKQIGVTIPPNVLARADRVIK